MSTILAAKSFTVPIWAIPDDLLAENTRSLTDDPATGANSLSGTLGRITSKWWRPRRKATGIAFYGESQEFFQLRYLEGSPDGRRYDSAKGAGCRYYLPSVPDKYRARISDIWSISVPETGSLWDWAESAPECPIFDSEGAAKSLALIGIGYPAISGFGAFGGIERYEQQTFKRPVGKRKSGRFGGFVAEKVPLKQVRLAPDLARFAIEGRSFVLVPDMDTSPKTRRMVANQFLHRARLLEKRGCKVRIAYWDVSLGKGIDDVLAAHGEAVARQILDNPLTPTEFALKIELSFQLATPNATVDTRDLQIDAPELPKVGIVFSDSVVGTGKTKLGARETADRTMLAPYPLRSLAKAAATGLNADYRNEGKLNRKHGAYSGDEGLSDRLTICYDSLPRIDLTNQFAGELEDLFLDEITHGLRHALTGATCRVERIAITEKLIEAIKISKRVLAFDADLTRTELDIIRELRPGDTEYYLRNTRKPDPWIIQWLTLPSKQPTVNSAIEAIAGLMPKSGTGMIHWACDSLSTSEKIAAFLGEKQCAVINSDRTRDKDPKTVLAIGGHFDELEAQGVRHIITSPSVIQGLSWEQVGRFAAVVGTFSGCSITPRQMRQSLSRVREAVPRIIWAAPFRRAPGPWGNETEARLIKDRILQNSQFNSAALKADFELSDTRLVAVDIAARLIAADNLWSATPAASLRILLEDYGHQIKPCCVDADGEAFAESATAWQQSQDERVLNAQRMTDTEAKSLRAKAEGDKLTQSERIALARYDLCAFYAIDPEVLDLDLIQKDRDGLRSKVRAFENLVSADGEQLARQAAANSADLADIDRDRSLAALAARRVIGLSDIAVTLRSEALTKDSPKMMEFRDRCFTQRGNIRSVLRYSVKEDASPIKVAGELLSQIGLKLVSQRKRVAGQPVWFYSLDEEDLALLNEIAERRYQSRLDAVDRGDPHPSDIDLQRGVDHPLKSLKPLKSKEYSPTDTEEGKKRAAIAKPKPKAPPAEVQSAQPPPPQESKAIDPSTIEIPDEIDGWRIGDRAIVGIDHLDKRDQGQIKRGDEMPVGVPGEILRFDADRVAAMRGLTDYMIAMRFDGGRECRVGVDYLRPVKAIAV